MSTSERARKQKRAPSPSDDEPDGTPVADRELNEGASSLPGNVLPSTAHCRAAVLRPDVAERVQANKNVDFDTVKMSLGAFMTAEGRLLLSFDSILQDLNIGVLEAYALLNVHILRLCDAGTLVPPITQNLVRQCLSAVMVNDGNTRIAPEILSSLNVYNSVRYRDAPRGQRAGIMCGWQQYAARGMKTSIHNALQMNFLRRFNKCIRAQYDVDASTAYALVDRIMLPEFVRSPPGTPNRQLLDDIVLEWWGEIPRLHTGRMNYAPHKLVPLMYRFLQVIERHNVEIGERVVDARASAQTESVIRQIQSRTVKPFTVLPTKRGFCVSHVTMDSIGLRELLVRNAISVPTYQQWNEVSDIYWRRFFRIDKVETTETGHRRFAGEISTDGKAVSITVQKPKVTHCDLNGKDHEEGEFDARWGLDPGRCNLFVATNEHNETVACSGREYREGAYITKSERKHNQWVRHRPYIDAVFNAMPSKKSASLLQWERYIGYMTQNLQVLLAFFQQKPYRRNKLRRYIYKKKKLRELCRRLVQTSQRVVVGFGNYSNRDPDGTIRGQPLAPVKKLAQELSKTSRCKVVMVDEFRTSKVHYDCQRELSKQYPYRKAAARVRAIHEGRPTFPVYSVLHCRNNGCSGITVNRDVNASKNMLRLLDCQLNGEPRPVAYTRQASG